MMHIFESNGFFTKLMGQRSRNHEFKYSESNFNLTYFKFQEFKRKNIISIFTIHESAL